MSPTSTPPDPGPAPTRLRQIALVAEDLARAEKLLTTVLGTEVIFVDPGVEKWGLRNILVAIGGDVIEVVCPINPGTSTTAGRLLAKRGDGGYMIIMQTADAKARREYIEARGLARVIHAHEFEGDGGSVCIQYHPRDVKGGMMPELDSHTPTPTHPDPLTAPFSPWHACGTDYASYSAGMRRRAHLSLRRAVCRLEPGDQDVNIAAGQWERAFGVPRKGSGASIVGGNVLDFTNAELVFEAGQEGRAAGLVSVTIAVSGPDEVEGVLGRARKVGSLACGGDGGEAWVDMLGVRWYFVPAEPGVGVKSRM